MWKFDVFCCSKWCPRRTFLSSSFLPFDIAWVSNTPNREYLSLASFIILRHRWDQIFASIRRHTRIFFWNEIFFFNFDILNVVVANVIFLVEYFVFHVMNRFEKEYSSIARFLLSSSDLTLKNFFVRHFERSSLRWLYFWSNCFFFEAFEKINSNSWKVFQSP